MNKKGVTKMTVKRLLAGVISAAILTQGICVLPVLARENAATYADILNTIGNNEMKIYGKAVQAGESPQVKDTVPKTSYEMETKYIAEDNTAVITIDTAVNDVDVIFAAYAADGRLMSLDVRNTDLSRGVNNCPAEDFDAALADDVKVMVWESLESMKPLHIEAGGTAYYIDSQNGSDDNDGTSPETAWKSAERINKVEAFEPGDRILFKAGGEWTAPLNANTYISTEDDDNDGRYDYWIMPKGSGEKGNPIVIGAYGEGALPKLIGASNTNSTLAIKDEEYWDISNLDISNYDETFDYKNPKNTENAQKMGDLRGIDIFGQSFDKLDDNGNRVIHGYNLHDLYIHDITGYVYWGGAPADRGYPGVYGNMGQDASKRTGGIVFEVWKPTTETYLGFTQAQKEQYDNLNKQLNGYTGTAKTYVDALLMKQAAEDRNSYSEAEQTKYSTAQTALNAENAELVNTIDTEFDELQELIAVRKAVQALNSQDKAITFDDVTIENNIIYDTSFGGITVKQWEGDGHKEVDVSPFHIDAVQKTNEAWGKREGADKYWDNDTKTLTKEDEGWHPHTNIKIKNNYVSQEGMEQGCNTIRIASVKGALIERNVCAGSGTCAIELDYIDDSVTQFNEIYGTYKKMGGADNNAIDTDYRTTNCLVQYNYVYNNGDSFLLCGRAFSTAVYRYNIAANSGTADNFVAVDGDKGYNYIYNNLFYNSQKASTISYISDNGDAKRSLASINPLYIYNNVFYNACADTTSAKIQEKSGTIYYDSNSYYGGGITDTESDNNAVTNKPFITGDDLASFAVSDKSPLINSGKAVELPASFTGIYVNQYKDLKDMYGNNVDSAPDIGVNEYQIAKGKGIIRGYITDEYSQPLAGVTVSQAASVTAITDENGYYSFGKVDAGSYTLTASKENYTAIEGQPTTVTDGEAVTINFENMTSTVTTGTVTGKITCAGVPAANVTVAAVLNGVQKVTAATDENGIYTLTVDAGRYTLTVSGNGYKTQSREDVEIQKNSKNENINFGIQSSSAEEHTYAIKDNFDDYNSGALNSAIWETSGTGSATVVADTDGENKYIKIAKSGKNSFSMHNKAAAMLGITDDNADGIITIGARIMRTSGSNQFNMFSYNEANSWANKKNPMATFAMTGGKIISHYLDGTGASAAIDAGSYTQNQWDKVWIVANLKTQTYDFYLNNTDAPALINLPLRNTANNQTIDYFRFYSDANGDGDMCVDYFYTCTGVQLDETAVPYVSYADGEGSITGTVTHTGEKVEGAKVSVIKDGVEKASSTTNSEGAYAINNVPVEKDYTINVTKDGYKTATRGNINIAKDSSYIYDFSIRQDRTEVETYVINDDFNSYETGMWESAQNGEDTANLHGDAQWRAYNTSGSDRVVEISSEDETNKYLHISRSSSSGNTASGVYNQADINLNSGVVTIEARVKRTKTTGQISMYSFDNGKFDANSPKGNNAISTFYLSGGKINTHTNSGTAAVTDYTADTWNDIRIVLNYTTKTFDFYVDDMNEARLINQALKNSSDTLNRFLLYSSDKNADMCIDYFRVYEGEPYDGE